jgi:pimeloyl-ACP methyl ester carboxylesterase
MSAPVERSVAVNGEPCRVWEKSGREEGAQESGAGEPLGFLASLGGCSHWTPFLERLAERRRLVVPSLPGFPGGGSGHKKLDDLPDWIAATLDLLEAAGLEGADLVGHGVGGVLAAEVAALSRATVRRLVLIAPLGLFDAAEPVADAWARRASELPALLSTRPEAFAKELLPPEGCDEVEWQIELLRASEAAARLLWPTADRGLAKRLHRIQAPTLLLWGSEDRLVPASYAKRFADGIAGAASLRSIEGAGHRVDFDAPAATADAILEFLGGDVPATRRAG